MKFGFVCLHFVLFSHSLGLIANLAFWFSLLSLLQAQHFVAPSTLSTSCTSPFASVEYVNIASGKELQGQSGAQESYFTKHFGVSNGKTVLFCLQEVDKTHSRSYEWQKILQGTMARICHLKTSARVIWYAQTAFCTQTRAKERLCDCTGGSRHPGWIAASAPPPANRSDSPWYLCSIRPLSSAFPGGSCLTPHLRPTCVGLTQMCPTRQIRPIQVGPVPLHGKG